MRNLLPRETWALMQAPPEAVLIDLRMEIESMYVGRPPGAINIPRYRNPAFTPRPSRSVLPGGGGVLWGWIG